MCHDKTQTDTAEILELDTAIAIAIASIIILLPVSY